MKLRTPLRFSLFVLVSCLVAVTIAQEQAKKARPGTHFLTPDTMQERGFSIKCDFMDYTAIRAGKKERNGVVRIQVIFDAEKGPKISEMTSALLVINDDNRLVSVPVRTYNDPKSGDIRWLQFTVHEDLIPITEVVLNVDKQGSWYRHTILVDEFYKVYKAGME